MNPTIDYPKRYIKNKRLVQSQDGHNNQTGDILTDYDDLNFTPISKIGVTNFWEIPLNYLPKVCGVIFMVLTLSVAMGWAEQINLKWAPVNSPQNDGYRVYYRTDNHSYDFAHPLWQGTANEIQVYNLNKQTQYYFVVRTYSSAGFESANSNEVFFPLHHYRDHLAVDFGAAGLYDYDGTDWNPVSAFNAEQMVGIQGGLFADFGNAGLYRFDGANWQNIDSGNALMCINWGGQLVASFDPQGVALFQTNGNRKGLTSAIPEMMAPTGDGFMASFSQLGLFAYTTGGWKYITDWLADGCVRWQYGVAIDVGVNGLWNYSDKGWLKLDSSNPTRIVAFQSGIVVDYDARGLFYYDAGGWQLISQWNPDLVIPWENGLAVSFEGRGLWNYSQSSWQRLNADTPQQIVAWAQGLAVDFGSQGLWNCSSQDQSWEQIAIQSPENIVDFY